MLKRCWECVGREEVVVWEGEGVEVGGDGMGVDKGGDGWGELCCVVVVIGVGESWVWCVVCVNCGV